MYTYVKSSIEDNGLFFEQYLNELTSFYDNYYEDSILTSDFYSIFMDDHHAGYFAVREDLMTRFRAAGIIISAVKKPSRVPGISQQPGC
jgi:hypothetical protein